MRSCICALSLGGCCFCAVRSLLAPTCSDAAGWRDVCLQASGLSAAQRARQPAGCAPAFLPLLRASGCGHSMAGPCLKAAQDTFRRHAHSAALHLACRVPHGRRHLCLLYSCACDRAAAYPGWLPSLFPFCSEQQGCCPCRVSCTAVFKSTTPLWADFTQVLDAPASTWSFLEFLPRLQIPGPL